MTWQQHQQGHRDAVHILWTHNKVTRTQRLHEPQAIHVHTNSKSQDFTALWWINFLPKQSLLRTRCAHVVTSPKPGFCQHSLSTFPSLFQQSSGWHMHAFSNFEDTLIRIVLKLCNRICSIILEKKIFLALSKTKIKLLSQWDSFL